MKKYKKSQARTIDLKCIGQRGVKNLINPDKSYSVSDRED